MLEKPAKAGSSICLLFMNRGFKRRRRTAVTRRGATQWSSPQDLTAVLRLLYLARSRPSPASTASCIVSLGVAEGEEQGAIAHRLK